MENTEDSQTLTMSIVITYLLAILFLSIHAIPQWDKDLGVGNG